ncbi:MAG: site-specific DNA-methyltransferase [Bacteroidales bacterium]|nr:site-specific DNA-methyltransferase [Bacteroidales bacterium]
MSEPYFKSKDKNFYLLQGDTMDLLPKINHKFDMVFADPPYFLSNNGLSIQSGKIVSVNKGKWDKSHGFDYINNFNRKWLKQVRELMKEDATIWISGTMHNIFSIGQILTELDFKILNIITWQKTNPPPNFSCRYFTYSTEQIIWARKSKKVPHFYNYKLMKQLNGDKQMQDVWKLPAIAKWEKSCKKHPTQKPLSILTRIIMASTKPNAWVLDPFAGSSTTGIASNLANRRFLGIDKEAEYLEISKCRKIEIEKKEVAELYKNKISGFNNQKEFASFLEKEPKPSKKVALGFCRKKDIPNLTKTNKFYFHAIEQDNFVQDFPTEILDAKIIYLYQGGRGKPLFFIGYYGGIKSIKLKHKSKIKGKENSRTEYYYEIELEKNFELNKYLTSKLDTKILFYKNDKTNKELLNKYLPAITTIDKVELNINKYKSTNA